MERQLKIMLGTNSAIQDVLKEHGIEPKAGDTKHSWDSDNPAEVEGARKLFDTLRARGYVAFRVNPKGKQADRMDKFDPDAEGMIMVAQVAGG